MEGVCGEDDERDVEFIIRCNLWCFFFSKITLYHSCSLPIIYPDGTGSFLRIFWARL